MPTIGLTENNTRKWKCAWMQNAEQRFLQFLIQTKHFNIPNSLGFPLTVIESFQTLLWEGLWCSRCPKSITIIWCTTTAKVNTDKWQPESNQNFISASWWRIKTSASPQIAGVLQKLWLAQEPAENFLPSLFFMAMFIVHINFLHECTDQLWWQWTLVQTGIFFRLTRAMNSSKSRKFTRIAEIWYSSACFV